MVEYFYEGNTGKNNTEALESKRLAALDNDVKNQVGAELGLYVYMLVDSRNGMPFYVGKGVGSRFASHGIEDEKAADSQEEQSLKVSKINEIRAVDLEPEIWILRHGMKTKTEYTAVEAAAIDLLHSFPLQRQHDAGARIPEQYM